MHPNCVLSRLALNASLLNGPLHSMLCRTAGRLLASRRVAALLSLPASELLAFEPVR